MTDVSRYSTDAPARQDVEALRGVVVLEFGTDWCGHCQAAQGVIRQTLASHPHVHHLKVEDGKGRPLGRAFGVKRWPTLVVLQDGREVAKLVRPIDATPLAEVLASLPP